MMRWMLLAAAMALGTGAAAAQSLPADIPKTFLPATATFDHVRRVVEIPMRDGVTLHTVILLPRDAHDAPILLDRTPYGADSETERAGSSHVAIAAPLAGRFVGHGYIFVTQDVRGKFDSKGDYVNERPLIGPENHTGIDHATDAWDTIDWLVKHVPESNGRVGMIGTSYDGMMVAMALTAPHPALKAAVPANPVIDTWQGDDDFHGGAFRLIGYDYYYQQDAEADDAGDLWRGGYDDYDNFLRAGSASGFVASHGLAQLPVVRRFHDHPAYDAYWRAQALQDLLPRRTPTVPTLWIAGQWDQEDMYGAVAAWEKLHAVDPSGLNHLVIGPWAHGGWNGDGSILGPIRFDSDTAGWFRAHVLLPFLDANLKTGGKPLDLPPVLAFQTGANDWQRLATWPLSCASGCPQAASRLYLTQDGGLSFTAPTTTGIDSYIADPAKPVPYRLRPIRPTYSTGSTWRQWLVDDQRLFSDRPDVLTYRTPPLDRPVAIAGAAMANIVATTTGTDGDMVVKLIDVYPDEYPGRPEMGGYQLGIAMDIFRGRYRDGYGTAKPVAANTPLASRFALPNADHVFLPGHRIMVQIQSSWFPLYDRNPQTFVANIFDAKPADYRKATIGILRGPDAASFIELPTVAAPAEAP